MGKGHTFIAILVASTFGLSIAQAKPHNEPYTVFQQYSPKVERHKVHRIRHVHHQKKHAATHKAHKPAPSSKASIAAAIIEHLKKTIPIDPPAPVIRITEAIDEALSLPATVLDALRPNPVRDAKEYLIRTAHPGTTMSILGTRLAICYLNPDFALRLAGAVRKARAQGIDAGIFSAGRPPALGVGAMRDKAESMHAAGLAVDMAGIGGPGSRTAQRWYTIAANEGIIRPYPAAVEWNHMQPTAVHTTSQAGIKSLITPKGPSSFTTLWMKQKRLIMTVTQALKFHPGTRVAQRHVAKHRRHA